MVKIKAKKTRYKNSVWDKLFVVTNYIVLTLIALTMLYPIINVVAVSLSNYQEYLKNE